MKNHITEMDKLYKSTMSYIEYSDENDILIDNPWAWNVINTEERFTKEELLDRIDKVSSYKDISVTDESALVNSIAFRKKEADYLKRYHTSEELVKRVNEWIKNARSEYDPITLKD